MPGVLAGVIWAFKDKRYLGAAMTGIFLGLIIMSGHYQMVYYTGIIVLFIGFVEFINATKKKSYVSLGINVGILFLAALLAFGANYNRISTLLEYSKYSTRGTSDLVTGAGEKSKSESNGLDFEYITAWSNGIGETFTLLIPNFRGGASAAELSKDGEVFKTLKENNIRGAENLIKQMPVYWGPKPSTSGPSYQGAAVFFLFILGLFLIKDKNKWWLAGATFLAIMLSWGKHFPGLTHFFIDYFPGYNKFRDVTMTLIIVQVTMPILAFLTLNRLFTELPKISELKKPLLYSSLLTGAFCLLIAIAPSLAGSYSGIADSQLPNWLQEPLKADRISLVRADAFRSFIVIAITLLTIYYVLNNQLEKGYGIAIIAVLVTVDLWGVGSRYLTNSDMVRPQAAYTMNNADKFILKDKEADFRVLNMSVSPFQDASTSAFHKSVGGYSAAKMKRYQELIENVMIDDMQRLISRAQKQQFDSIFSGLNSINMLNTKYVIFNAEMQPIQNYMALGNCWSVEKYISAKDSREELDILKHLDLENKLVIRETIEKEYMLKSSYEKGKIKLEEYRANYLKYSTESSSDMLAVFSEIYYPKGWVAFLVGKI